ncbi:MAG: hypothetical protein SH859_16715 [Hyphomicrobium aestuarii]|nr:hypothetical protein [Hyphomicrobium aestuarii]
MRNVLAWLTALLGFAPRASATAAKTTSTHDSANACYGTVNVEADDTVPVEIEPAATIAADTVLSSEHDAPTSNRRMSLRLRSVGCLNKKSRRRKPGSVKTRKRAPDLYPMKRRPAVAKKPVLKVLQPKPKVRPSAMIIQFPAARIRKARLKMAA